MSHWHVATGLSGYGPDGSDGYGTATAAHSLAHLVEHECAHLAEHELQRAYGNAEGRDFEAAWNAFLSSDRLATLGMNFDYGRRSQAPAYINNVAALDETILRMARDEFPLPFDEGRSKLYVWECMTAECEHLAELDND